MTAIPEKIQDAMDHHNAVRKDCFVVLSPLNRLWAMITMNTVLIMTHMFLLPPWDLLYLYTGACVVLANLGLVYTIGTPAKVSCAIPILWSNLQDDQQSLVEDNLSEVLVLAERAQGLKNKDTQAWEQFLIFQNRFLEILYEWDCDPKDVSPSHPRVASTLMVMSGVVNEALGLQDGDNFEKTHKLMTSVNDNLVKIRLDNRDNNHERLESFDRLTDHLIK